MQIPSNVQSILNDERCENITESVSNTMLLRSCHLCILYDVMFPCLFLENFSILNKSVLVFFFIYFQRMF